MIKLKIFKDMEGKIIFSILDFLEETTGNFSDLFVAYLNAGYTISHSYGKMSREIEKAREARWKRKFDRNKKGDDEVEKRKQCAKMIFYLKKSGLIVKKDSVFSITKKGIERKKEFAEKILKSLPIIDYQKIKFKKPILITFDIPEKERRKRGWIRDVLSYLDFKMIHKSVWVGFVKVPEEFIKDLSRIGLSGFVEIIKIGGKGTLQKMFEEN